MPAGAEQSNRDAACCKQNEAGEPENAPASEVVRRDAERAQARRRVDGAVAQTGVPNGESDGEKLQCRAIAEHECILTSRVRSVSGGGFDGFAELAQELT